MQKLLFLLAGEESHRIAERVRPNMRKRAEEGRWLCRPPFGYTKEGTRPGGLAVDEVTAPVVREMFRRCAAGESIYSIHAWLNTLTLPNGERLPSPRGKWFGTTFAVHVLRNPVYCGMVRWGVNAYGKFEGRFRRPDAEHVLVPGQHEPLVDRETFDQVQAMLDAIALRKRPQRTRQCFLLTGLLTCGTCGRAICGLRGYKRNKTPGGYYYYRCGMFHGRWAGKALDAAILAAVATLPLGDEAIRLVVEAIAQDAAAQPDRTRELLAQRKRHEDRRKRLNRALADGTMDHADYQETIAEVKEAMAIIDRELAAMEPRQDTTALLEQARAWLHKAGDLGTVLEAATLEERRELVGGAVHEVVLTMGAEPVITWEPWAALLWEAMAIPA
jgi:hypothetical protein